MPTTWTDEDVETLKAAIKGGVLNVTYDGPPRRSVTYQSLSAMRDLLAEMTRSANSAPTYRLVKTSKGF